MKKTQKIAIFALLCMVSAQLNAAFSPLGMNAVENHGISEVVASQASCHHEGGPGQHEHQGMHHGNECVAQGPSSNHHQTMDCDEQCMNCVNHCSSIGIQEDTSNQFDLRYCLSLTLDRNSLSRIENPYRPPIIS